MSPKLKTELSRKKNRFSVAERRRKLKILSIEYKGGKCQECGYNKCIAALVFHHLDPSQKDFGISGDIKSFERIKPELDKCILLCHNCHVELHQVEHDKQRLLKIESINAEDNPIPKKIGINWNDIDLEEMLKTKSVYEIAEFLNCRHARIYNQMKKLGITTENQRNKKK